MNNHSMYDEFSQNYDRFVNWDARLSAEIPFLTSELGVLSTTFRQPITILDAACGTGQHAIALTKSGFQCAGADFSGEMIKIARNNADQAGVEIRFEPAGFGQLAKTFGKNQFDGLICLGNSLPHLLDEASLENALEDFMTVLKPGGKIILQNRNFDLVLDEQLRWMPPQTFRQNDETWIFARFYDFDPDDRLTFNIQILHSENGTDFTQKVISTRLWPMKKTLVQEFLLRAGFANLRYYGNLESEPFHPTNSGNLVITAKSS